MSRYVLYTSTERHRDWRRSRNGSRPSSTRKRGCSTIFELGTVRADRPLHTTSARFCIARSRRNDDAAQGKSQSFNTRFYIPHLVRRHQARRVVGRRLLSLAGSARGGSRRGGGRFESFSSAILVRLAAVSDSRSAVLLVDVDIPVRTLLQTPNYNLSLYTDRVTRLTHAWVQDVTGFLLEALIERQVVSNLTGGLC
jgi:hypothetical protein